VVRKKREREGAGERKGWREKERTREGERERAREMAIGLFALIFFEAPLDRECASEKERERESLYVRRFTCMCIYMKYVVIAT